MDVRLSRLEIPDRGTDPHDWNAWDTYQHIHEQRLSEHPFVDHSNPDTLSYSEQFGLIRQSGRVYCLRDVVLEVDKTLERATIANVPKVRGKSYRYVAWIRGGHPVLRYHNLHEDERDYIHRVFDPRTGRQVGYETLRRFQFPTLAEIIDEIERVLEIYAL